MLNYIVGGTEVSWVVFLTVGESHCVSHPGQSHAACPTLGSVTQFVPRLDRVPLRVLLWTEILRQRSLYVLKAACESC